MAADAPRRLGPIWVWLAGLVVLIVAIWLLVDWVENRDGATGSAVVPPAAESMRADGGLEDREAAIRDVERNSVPIALAAIAPLGPEDTGIHATFAGVVVGEVIDDGAWVRTDAGVLFLRVVDDDAALETGERVQGRGIVRHDRGRVRAWMREAGLRGAERPRIVGGYYLETTTDRLGDP